MAEYSGFFDAMYNESDDTYDREYLAEQFANYFKLFVGNGVFGSPTDQCKVRAGTGMEIIVSSGWAFIEGYWYYNESEKRILVPSNVTPTARGDSVRLRWDNMTRKITAEYFVGNTQLVRDGTYYDLKIAEIVIPPATNEVLTQNITDTRPQESVCGFVTGLLEVQATEDLFAQYQAIFEEWFESIKDLLPANIATTSKAGLVKPDGVTILVQPDGTIRTNHRVYADLSQLGLTAPKTCLEVATAMPNNSQIALMISSSTATTVTDTPTNMGKLTIEKVNNNRCYAYFNEYTGDSGIPRMYVSYIRPLNSVASDWTEYLTTSRLANDLVTTVQGKALDAVQGKVLNDKITENRGFVLSNKATLTFVSNVCTINNARITADSLADVYFTSDTYEIAEKAKISVETYNGNVKLTAAKTPTGTIKASITIREVS